MGQQPVRALYVTLRRSFAGTRDTQCAVVRALGLRYRQQTVRVPNNAKMRGAIAKVPHLLSVETDEVFQARKQSEAEAVQPREPVRVLHKQKH